MSETIWKVEHREYAPIEEIKKDTDRNFNVFIVTIVVLLLFTVSLAVGNSYYREFETKSAKVMVINQQGLCHPNLILDVEGEYVNYKLLSQKEKNLLTKIKKGDIILVIKGKDLWGDWHNIGIGDIKR